MAAPRPISEAPRDGSRILGWCPPVTARLDPFPGYWTSVRWLGDPPPPQGVEEEEVFPAFEDTYGWVAVEDGSEIAVTHWLPEPPAPEVTP